MKVGLFLNTQFVEGDSLAARLPELVEQVRLARASGFASRAGGRARSAEAMNSIGCLSFGSGWLHASGASTYAA
jgi:hypothetical protein